MFITYTSDVTLDYLPLINQKATFKRTAEILPCISTILYCLLWILYQNKCDMCEYIGAFTIICFKQVYLFPLIIKGNHTCKIQIDVQRLLSTSNPQIHVRFLRHRHLYLRSMSFFQILKSASNS